MPTLNSPLRHDTLLELVSSSIECAALNLRTSIQSFVRKSHRTVTCEAPPGTGRNSSRASSAGGPYYGHRRPVVDCLDSENRMAQPDQSSNHVIKVLAPLVGITDSVLRTRDPQTLTKRQLMRFGQQGWELVDRPRSGEHSPPGADNPVQVVAWLRGFKRDSSRMRSLRALLARKLPRDLSRMSDDDVIDGVAALVSRGRLQIVAPAQPRPQMVAAPSPMPVPAPRMPSPPRPPPMPGLSFEPPLLPNVAAQAAVLVAAAATSAPFCPI